MHILYSIIKLVYGFKAICLDPLDANNYLANN
jgi:hypothetical protein